MPNLPLPGRFGVGLDPRVISDWKVPWCQICLFRADLEWDLIPEPLVTEECPDAKSAQVMQIWRALDPSGTHLASWGQSMAWCQICSCWDCPDRFYRRIAVHQTVQFNLEQWAQPQYGATTNTSVYHGISTGPTDQRGVKNPAQRLQYRWAANSAHS